MPAFIRRLADIKKIPVYVFVDGDPYGISNIAAIGYQDIPDKDGGDNIRYLGAAIVDKGSASSDGNFNDKPVIIADIARGKKGKPTSPAARILEHKCIASTENGRSACRP
jgi:hypothetical protein